MNKIHFSGEAAAKSCPQSSTPPQAQVAHTVGPAAAQ